jgi:ATP-dependent Clp protease adaptor protein ClpS
MTTGDPSAHADTEHALEAGLEPPARVILFNDEVHTFEEVIQQIIKATACDTPRAEALTWEVHHSGKANVFEGAITRCVQVSAVLEEIELLTQIEV